MTHVTKVRMLTPSPRGITGPTKPKIPGVEDQSARGEEVSIRLNSETTIPDRSEPS